MRKLNSSYRNIKYITECEDTGSCEQSNVKRQFHTLCDIILSISLFFIITSPSSFFLCPCLWHKGQSRQTLDLIMKPDPLFFSLSHRHKEASPDFDLTSSTFIPLSLALSPHSFLQGKEKQTEDSLCQIHWPSNSLNHNCCLCLFFLSFFLCAPLHLLSFCEWKGHQIEPSRGTAMQHCWSVINFCQSSLQQPLMILLPHQIDPALSRQSIDIYYYTSSNLILSSCKRQDQSLLWPSVKVLLLGDIYSNYDWNTRRSMMPQSHIRGWLGWIDGSVNNRWALEL